MITYLYWLFVVMIAVAIVYVFAGKLRNWTGAVGLAAIVLLVGWAAYFFYFQQIFVKRWGGVMSVSVPEGQQHITATWKDENLWIENYNPENNTCIFTEYSKGNLLEGRVTIKNCNPIGR